MIAHAIYNTNEDGHNIGVCGWVSPAAPEDVAIVLAADETAEFDGRSPWMWVRLQNGDLMLATFPQGDTYMAVSDAAEYNA